MSQSDLQRLASPHTEAFHMSQPMCLQQRLLSTLLIAAQAMSTQCTAVTVDQAVADAQRHDVALQLPHDAALDASQSRWGLPSKLNFLRD